MSMVDFLLMLEQLIRYFDLDFDVFVVLLVLFITSFKLFSVMDSICFHCTRKISML